MVKYWFFLISLFGVLSSPFTGLAETRVEQDIETRIVLTFQVSPEEAQKWLPPPWKVNPISAGPSKNANLLLMFRNRELNLDENDQPVPGGAERGAVLIVPSKNSDTGEIGAYVIRIFTGNPKFLPGDYKNSVPSNIRYEHSLKTGNSDSGIGEDIWEIRDKEGGAIYFNLIYRREAAVRSKSNTKTSGGPDPNFFRIYDADQGLDVVRSIPDSIDRVKEFKFHVTMAELGKLFNGSEKLVSITVIPWYIRNVFLP